MVICKMNPSATVKYNNIDYLEVRRNTFFFISLLHNPLEQFHKEENTLLKTFLFLVSTVMADEDRSRGALKF